MDDHRRIEGVAKLTDLFGRWPSFHDAEVVSARLDRRAYREGESGPTLDLSIHAFEMTSEVDATGFFVLRNHVLVDLRFHGVLGVSLQDFNIQNVLSSLSIELVSEPSEDDAAFDVGLGSTYGLWGGFRCRRVEVVGVAPCTKDAESIPGER